MVVTCPVFQFRGWLKALAHANTVKKVWEKKQFSNISLQLTAIHGRHFFGLPVQGLVEGTGLVKHCVKKGVREETVFKHITTTYCIASSSPPSYSSWRCRRWRQWPQKTLWRKRGVREESKNKYHYNLLKDMSFTCPVFQPEMSPLKSWAPANTVWKGVREKKQFENISLQLTFVHVHHLSGIPARDVAVEGSGIFKHCRKKRCERRNSFQTLLQLTAIHGRH